MPSQKKFVRIVAVILALLMALSVIFVALHVIASAAPYSVGAAVSASPGDDFPMPVIVIFFAALAVLAALLIFYFINKRKK